MAKLLTLTANFLAFGVSWQTASSTFFRTENSTSEPILADPTSHLRSC